MEKVLVLLLVTLAVAYAVPDPRGIIINLDEGELCLNSAQCTSKCCHREDGLSLARCAPKASENSECSAFVSAGGQGVGGWQRQLGRYSSAWGGPSRLGGGLREEGQSGHRMLEVKGGQHTSKPFPIPSALEPHNRPVMWAGQRGVTHPISWVGKQTLLRETKLVRATQWTAEPRSSRPTAPPAPPRGGTKEKRHLGQLARTVCDHPVSADALWDLLQVSL
ncbi:colipase isoform X1 [Bos indicus x Bos taurus]|uniref:colipase isoform X1 n=1 Tax=Bos indicus x Bos taurus TaxID=30522 RepID=UPI000F7D282F|nr:colipase isoform X1 [Bos indicus x Bos taurus]